MAGVVWLFAGVAVAAWGAGLLGRGGDMAASPLGVAVVAVLVPIVLLASACALRLGRRLQREAAARRPASMTFGLYLAIAVLAVPVIGDHPSLQPLEWLLLAVAAAPIVALAVDTRRVGSARGSPPP